MLDLASLYLLHHTQLRDCEKQKLPSLSWQTIKHWWLSSFICQQKEWQNRSELWSKKRKNAAFTLLKAVSPIFALSLIAIKGRKMLSGPSAQTWLAWIQGKSAMRSALNQEGVPLPTIVSTQPLGHSMVLSPAYLILYPHLTLFTGRGMWLSFSLFML